LRLRPELTGVVESPLVQIATAAEAMPGSLKLCYGESDLPTPAFICDALDRAARAGHTFYTHTAGAIDLREAIAEKIRALHGLDYRPTEVMASAGASMAIYTAIRALVGPGDNAVIVAPAYAIFANGTIMAGGEPRLVPLARDGHRFCLDVDRLRAAIDGRTRLLVVNSPSNPTGWMASAGERRALAELAERHDVMLLSDEVYERLAYDTDPAPNLATIVPRERVIVVNSFSKTYNMTGWRLGWAQAAEPVIRTLYTAAEFITSNPTAMVQRAGIVALRDGEAYVRELRQHYARRRAQVIRALAALPGVSLPAIEGAFYAFPRIEGLTNSARFAERLLADTGVALAPGTAFGAAGEGHVRICFAAREETLTQALTRLGAFLTLDS
jgi:aspartate/methionine/tyrosine aminotransferase